MIKLFRGLILLAVACVVAVAVLPGNPVDITVPLPQPGDPLDVMTFIGVLACLLGALAFVLVAGSAVGLLAVKRWARPIAIVATALSLACVATALFLFPIPIAPMFTPLQIVILGVSIAAWVAALWLLRTPEIRARFAAG